MTKWKLGTSLGRPSMIFQGVAVHMVSWGLIWHRAPDWAFVFCMFNPCFYICLYVDEIT